MNRYDCAIIGSGPAALSSAINLKIRNKNIIIFGDKELSVKINKADTINNYLGISEISGENLNKLFFEHIEKMGIEINQDRVVGIYNMGNYFDIVTRNNIEYESSTVIIATGIQYSKYYDGEEKFIGRGISYCSMCDGLLYKNKNVAIIGDFNNCKGDIEYLSSICANVYYITKKNVEFYVSENVKIINDKIKFIEGDVKVNKLVLENSTIKINGIFIIRDNVMIDQLIPGITTEKGRIIVDRNMHTNIKGCFAAGDVTGKPYQIIKSAGEGNIASFSVLEYLDNIK